MDSTVIVALPALDDKVYRISSEKVPHLTICFLGDQVNEANFQEIFEYVQHASTVLDPFGLEVTHRGTLGPDDADVLFFDKNGWSIEGIADFRHYLLLNDTIKRAYDAVDQYPEWTPHLTLGYPETPAHEDTSDYPGINYVRFDRIAIWNDDSSGPEFRLTNDSSQRELAMSDTESDILSHHGVKGMKWGVRRDEGHEGEKVKTKKLAKLDKQWENEAFIKAHNKMADKMNNGMIDEFNNDPRWKGKDFNDPKNAKLHDEYMDAFFKKSDEVFAESLVSLGLNPSGTKRFVLKEDGNGSYAEYTDVSEVKHEGAGKKKILRIRKDDLGHIRSVNEQEVDLAHYGVKGMKWGVTKVDRASQPTLHREKQSRLDSKEVTVTQRKAGTYVKTKGGQRQKASDDAVKAHAGRQKAKKSTTDALTNDELKAVVERLRLEQEYAKLDAKVKRRGNSMVSRLFQTPEGRKTTEDLLKRIAAANA